MSKHTLLLPDSPVPADLGLRFTTQKIAINNAYDVSAVLGEWKHVYHGASTFQHSFKAKSKHKHTFTRLQWALRPTVCTSSKSPVVLTYSSAPDTSTLPPPFLPDLGRIILKVVFIQIKPLRVWNHWRELYHPVLRWGYQLHHLVCT